MIPQLVDAIQGLAYMHNQGIIHGDLKGVRVGRSIHFLRQLTRSQGQYHDR